MIWLIVRTTTSAKPAKVGADDGELTGQDGRYIAPHQVRLRESVQQQDGWAGPRAAEENRRLPGFHLECFELLECHAVGDHCGGARMGGFSRAGARYAGQDYLAHRIGARVCTGGLMT